MSWWRQLLLRPHPSSGFLSRAPALSPDWGFRHSQGPRCQTPGLGVGCELVSPPAQSGERAWGGGGGAVTFLVAEWPRGRGWVVMAMGIELGWGDSMPFHPLLSHPCVSGWRGGRSLCWAFLGGEGLDLCPQRPQGKGGGAQEPEDSMSGARCPSDSCPASTPSPGCVSAYFHPPSLPVSPSP